MFRHPKPKPEINTFEQEMMLKQQQMLQDNLKKSSVLPSDQKKIMEMRRELPNSYHQMPLSQPSQCFWLFENFMRPDQQTFLNKHRMDDFRKCESRFLNEINNSERDSTKGNRL